MINKECRFSYNNLDDSLIVSCREENENIKDRFGLGNFIFSLTGRGKIVGVQVINASEVLSDYNIAPNFLNRLKNINLLIAQKDSCLCVALILMIENDQAKIPIPLMNLTPNIH